MVQACWDVEALSGLETNALLSRFFFLRHSSRRVLRPVRFHHFPSSSVLSPCPTSPRLPSGNTRGGRLPEQTPAPGDGAPPHPTMSRRQHRPGEGAAALLTAVLLLLPFMAGATRLQPGSSPPLMSSQAYLSVQGGLQTALAPHFWFAGMPLASTLWGELSLCAAACANDPSCSYFNHCDAEVRSSARPLAQPKPVLPLFRRPPLHETLTCSQPSLTPPCTALNPW
jgi:hypothetical protein